MNKYFYMPILLASLLTFFMVVPSLADDEADDMSYEVEDVEARRCISTRSLRSTRVLDDRNILFYISGRTIYHNFLPKACKGLSREKRFSYRTSLGRLCDIDSIRILRSGGSGLEEGRSCGLGLFHPVSKEEVAAYFEDPKETPEAEPLTLPEPKEVRGKKDKTKENEKNAEIENQS